MQSIPQEVLDHIFSLVDEPSHLLSLALSCKQFKDLIIPFHIDYRHIRCDISRSFTWDTLSDNPRLASRVLILEIIDENDQASGSPIVPHDLANTPLRPFQESFILAIQCMNNIKKLVWKNQPVSEVILTAVSQSCPNLTAVEVFCPSFHSVHSLNHLSVWSKLQNLTQFSYFVSVPTYGANFLDEQDLEEHLETFISLLNKNCPDLEDLQIDIDNDQAYLRDLFTGVTWPQLKRLSIQAVLIHEDHRTFFPSLVGLQTLSITDTFTSSDLDFDFTGLDNLQSLELFCAPQLRAPVTRNLTSLSFQIQSDMRLGLESFFDELDPEGSNVLELSDEHLNGIRDCSNLRNLVIRSKVSYKKPLQSLLRVAPSTLERLAYDGISWPEGDVLKDQDMDELARMVNLTHLAFVGVDDQEVSDYAAHDASATQSSIVALSLTVPKLEFIGLAPRDGSSSWIRINRDSAGSFSSYTKISKGTYQDDVEFNRWGGHYCGVKPVESIPGVEGPSWIHVGENDQISDSVFVADYEV